MAISLEPASYYTQINLFFNTIDYLLLIVTKKTKVGTNEFNLTSFIGV